LKLPPALVVVWTLLFTGSLFLYLNPREPIPQGTFVAHLKSKSGNVEFREPFFSTWKEAQIAQPFKAGSALATGPATTAIVEMSDGSEVKVAPNSQIIIGDPAANNREGMLVSITSGSLSYNKKSESQGGFLKILEDVVPQTKAAVSTFRKATGLADAGLKIQSGQVQIELDETTKSLSAVRSDDVFTLKADGGVSASAGKKLIGNAISEGLLVMKENSASGGPELTQDENALLNSQNLLSDLEKELAQNRIVPTPEPTPTPVPAPFVSGEWELTEPAKESHWLLVESTPNNKNTVFTLRVKFGRKLKANELPPLPPALEITSQHKTHFLVEGASTGESIFSYTLTANHMASILTKEKGIVKMQLALKGDSERFQKLGAIQFTSVSHLDSKPYLLSISNPKPLPKTSNDWMRIGKLAPKKSESSRNSGTVWVSDKASLKKVFEHLDVSSGFSFLPASQAHTNAPADVYGKENTIQAVFLGNYFQTPQWRQHIAQSLDSALGFHGYAESFLPKEKFAEIIFSPQIPTSQHPKASSTFFIYTQGYAFSVTTSLLRKFTGLAHFISGLPSFVFNKPANIFWDSEGLSKKKENSEDSVPESLRQKTSFVKPNISVLLVREDTNRVLFPDLKSLDFSATHLFNFQRSLEVKTSLDINRISYTAAIKNPDTETEIFDALSKISKTDVLLAIRRTSHKTSVSKLLAFQKNREIFVEKKDGLLKGTEALRWVAESLGYNGLVSAQAADWARIETEGSTPKKGSIGFLVSEGHTSFLAHKPDTTRAPLMIVVCETPVAQSCISRVLSQSGKQAPAPGSKVLWVHEQAR
jgi:hypothetical protein